MLLEDLLKTCTQEEIINKLEKASLSSDLIELIKEDYECYEAVIKILKTMPGSLEKRTNQLNNEFQIMTLMDEN
jgi:hypothetical protein